MIYRVAICNNFSGEDWIEGFVGESSDNKVTAGLSEFVSKAFGTEQSANDYIERIRGFMLEGAPKAFMPKCMWVFDLYNQGHFLKVVEDGTTKTAEPDDWDDEELEDQD